MRSRKFPVGLPMNLMANGGFELIRTKQSFSTILKIRTVKLERVAPSSQYQDVMDGILHSCLGVCLEMSAANRESSHWLVFWSLTVYIKLFLYMSRYV